MKKPIIYHETIDTKIMQHLELIGFENFDEIISWKNFTGFKEFFVKTEIENRNFEVRFEIDLKQMTIEKDTQFFGYNKRTKEIEECTIIKRSNGSFTLQELFNEFVFNYKKWKDNEEKNN